MISLNEIAENIAYKLGDQFNTTLQESIKHTVLVYRAKLIRDDLDRNFLSEQHFLQNGVVQFEVVNLMTEFGADYGVITAICPDILKQAKYNILKSKTKVPIPLRLKRGSNRLYNYVGSVNGTKRFVYVSLEQFYFYKELPYNTRTVYFTVINDHIYILNNLNECDINDTLGIANVMVRSIFEKPSDFFDACVEDVPFADDAKFPIGLDMLQTIENAIVKGEYAVLPKDGQQVNIKPDDNE